MLQDPKKSYWIQQERRDTEQKPHDFEARTLVEITAGRETASNESHYFARSWRKQVADMIIRFADLLETPFQSKNSLLGAQRAKTKSAPVKRSDDVHIIIPYNKTFGYEKREVVNQFNFMDIVMANIETLQKRREVQDAFMKSTYYFVWVIYVPVEDRAVYGRTRNVCIVVL